MEKITLYADLFGKLNTLCETMGRDADATAPGKFAEHLREVNRLSNIVSDEADALAYRADEALDTLRYQNFVSGIDTLAVMVDRVSALRGTLDGLEQQLADALVALRALTAPASWSPLRTDAEMEEALDRGAELTNTITLAYRDGEYALLFEGGEDGTELLMPPFVFARGREEDEREVSAYLERFIELEYEEEG